MKDICKAIIVAFREILTWNVMKYALFSGAIVSIFWIGVGYLFWDNIITLSARIIEFVPFSMVRSNGAWMLSTFLWIQLVLVTYALIFAFFGNLILRSVSKDRYSYFSILVAIGSAIFWGIVWIYKGDFIYHQFLRLLTWLPFETIEKGIAFLIGFYIIYNAIVVTMLLLVSLFSEPFISYLHKKHYLEGEVVKTNIFSSIKYTIKDIIIFIVLSIVLFPLLFVPVINIFIQIALWLWLVKDTIYFDTALMVYEKFDYKKDKDHKVAIWIISFFTVLFNFIPVLNIFGPFFGEIAMFYYLKSSKTN